MASRTGWTGRVLIGAVAAMVLVALAAVPSFGAAKKFTIQVTPNSATVAGVSTEFTIAIANRTPGNSTINSFKVDAPFPLQLGLGPHGRTEGPPAACFHATERVGQPSASSADPRSECRAWIP